VFARTGSEKWPTAYDYQDIGRIVDKMVVMTYDYSYKESPAGPIAPLWWVQNVIDYMLEDVRVPANKLLIGMATYGYNWAPGQTTTTVTKDKLNTLEAKYDLVEDFDWSSMSPYYCYYDNSGTRHEIWLENGYSLEQKWQ
jgi:spore germination protein YaaH